MADDVLVVVGSGQRAYRQYLLDALARRHALVLVDPRPEPWHDEYFVDHLVLSPSDPPSRSRAAADLAARYDVRGVVTFHEPFVEPGARLAEALGVARTSAASISRTRDKWASRLAWDDAGVPSARCTLVGTEDEALKAATAIGYPVVVKPRALSASVGVTMADGPDRLRAAYRYARDWVFRDIENLRGDVLVEEYLDGPEISVDAMVLDGAVTPLVWATKHLAAPPYFEETGHVVGPPESFVPDVTGVEKVLQAAHDALGITSAVTHAEVRLTVSGPRMIEINGRSGGDLIPYLGLLASGVDVGRVVADIAAGVAPPAIAPERGAAGIRFLYPATEGHLTERGLPPDVEPPPWLDRLAWLAQVGDEISFAGKSLYERRLGFAIAVAETVVQCRQRLDEVEQAVRIVIRDD